MPFAKDQHLIQAFSPKSPDEPFDICVLPSRPRCCRMVPNAHRSQPVREDRTIGAIIVADQVGRRGVPWEGLNNLLRQPFIRRMPGHCEPKPAGGVHDR
jgi:hypothetical protein